MSRDKRLEIRLSEPEYNKLEAYAKQKDISMAQVLREYIKRLPNPKGELVIFVITTIAALSFPMPLHWAWELREERSIYLMVNRDEKHTPWIGRRDRFSSTTVDKNFLKSF